MGYAPLECSHYQTLGVQADASLADIKAAYRASLLRLHPDKAETLTQPVVPVSTAALPSRHQTASYPAELGGVDFAAVQRAWETLRHPDSRAAYDRWLAALTTRSQVAIADCLDLDDLTEVSTTGGLLGSKHQQQDSPDSIDFPGAGDRLFAYSCRCGSQYTLHEADLSDAADSIVVGCAGCSLHIRITYSVG